MRSKVAEIAFEAGLPGVETLELAVLDLKLDGSRRDRRQVNIEILH